MAGPDSYRYKVGIGNTGAYMLPGYPYLTGTFVGAGEEVKVSFPAVTKKITVIRHTSNSSGPVRISFRAPSHSANVTGSYHYIELDSDEDSFDFNVRAGEIYLSREAGSVGGNVHCRVYAELTNIGSDQMGPLTGSGVTDGPA